MTQALEFKNSIEGHPLRIIRTETALSRFPIHLLVKTGVENIEIVRRGDRGEVQLLWEVTYNRKYGPPRQLAYRLDTLIVNRRIEEAGRPLPKLLRLGTLNELCRELGGSNKGELRRAFLQNAGTQINAKLRYKLTNGEEQRIEAVFTRYSVIFTGQRLPESGASADAVYVILSEPYWEVLCGAQVRPLDYDYLKSLTPTAQRCYEIISYKIYSAIKYKHDCARLSYAEYCLYAAQLRHLDYRQVRKQMDKIHQLHLKSGYLAKVQFEPTIDEEGRPDWQMIYTPGLRAHGEYIHFTRKQSPLAPKPSSDLPQAEDAKPIQQVRVNHHKEIGVREDDDAGQAEDLLHALTGRGIIREKAKQLLRDAAPDQQIKRQLDWGDFLISKAAPSAIHNPAGFYVHLIKSNVTPPASFKQSDEIVDYEGEVHGPRNRRSNDSFTNAQRAAYQEYREKEVDRYIETRMSYEERQAVSEAIRRRLHNDFPEMSEWPPQTVEHTLRGLLHSEVRERVTLLDISTFISQQAAQAS